MAEEETDTVRFISNGVYTRDSNQPTLVVTNKLTGEVLEEHWLTGPAEAPMYDTSTDRQFNHVGYVFDDVHSRCVEGPFDSPKYVQRVIDGALHPSYVFQSGGHEVQHYLTGNEKNGKYGRNDANPYTIIFDSDVFLQVLGYESKPFVKIRNGLGTYFRTSTNTVLFLWGDLWREPGPITLDSLDALEFRYEPDAANGFAAVLNDLCVWASGHYNLATIQRTKDLPTAIQNGRKIWLDGYIAGGFISAVYWRADERLPTEVTASKRDLYTRGLFPAKLYAKKKAQPERIAAITHLATYQLRGTCYLNAAVNILVCTPAFRAHVVKHLQLVSAMPAGCPYDEHVYALFFSLLCKRDASFTPVRQTNVISHIETEMFPSQTLDAGGSVLKVLMILFSLFQLPLSMHRAHDGPARRSDVPANESLVHLVTCRRMSDLPRELTSANGTKFVLAAAGLSDNEHAVCALLDVSGQPHLVLDSNGSIWDTPWWPELNMSLIEMEVLYIHAVYVQVDFLLMRPVRCAMRALPASAAPDATACATRTENIDAQFKIQAAVTHIH